MKRVDWVLVWTVLVPVMLGLLGLLLLLARGMSYGVSPAETLVRISRPGTGVGILLAAPPAFILAMVVLWRLQLRGMKPVPTIVLTVVAWCVLTVATYLAIGGFGLLVVGFLSA